MGGEASSQALKRVGLVAVMAALAVTLGACRQEEQGRPLYYEKGVYQGQPDTKLTDEQLRELQYRGATQNF
jgi:hypothetical protein